MGGSKKGESWIGIGGVPERPILTRTLVRFRRLFRFAKNAKYNRARVVPSLATYELKFKDGENDKIDPK